MVDYQWTQVDENEVAQFVVVCRTENPQVSDNEATFIEFPIHCCPLSFGMDILETLCLNYIGVETYTKNAVWHYR